jgi:hypothetical protein
LPFSKAASQRERRRECKRRNDRGNERRQERLPGRGIARRRRRGLLPFPNRDRRKLVRGRRHALCISSVRSRPRVALADNVTARRRRNGLDGRRRRSPDDRSQPGLAAGRSRRADRQRALIVGGSVLGGRGIGTAPAALRAGSGRRVGADGR